MVDRRIALELRLQHETGELSEGTVRGYEQEYAQLQRELATLFRQSEDEHERIVTMLETMRILENRLVYLQNFMVDPTSDNRMLAQLVTKFIDELAHSQSTILTSLEAIYYRAVAALYAGDGARAAAGFREACASEQSDEANDIKYKSYVILGNLSHEERDYAQARELHDQSLRYSSNDNVTAQALALKALNSYALGEYDEALSHFQESLKLFDPNQPFFNSYFYRNAVLFCGAIYFDRKDYAKATEFYQRVVDTVEQTSYDYFDALAHLGRIHYASGRHEQAVEVLERALRTQRMSENEYVADLWFLIARAHLRRNDAASARPYLQKIAASEVPYEKKPQAVELLSRM